MLGFASAMRRCELAALEVGDITPAAGGIMVNVRRSKGDPHGVCRTIAIAQGRWPDSHPLAALDAWHRVRPVDAEHLFTRVHANGTADAEPINAASVVRIVKTRARAVGFTGDRVVAHSLRAGHATSAAMAGVPLDRIAAQSRHRDLATLVNSHIRPITQMQTTSSRHLGL